MEFFFSWANRKTCEKPLPRTKLRGQQRNNNINYNKNTDINNNNYINTNISGKSYG